MIEQPDLLAERFAALTNRLDDSDWHEVRRRAQTARRGTRRRWQLAIALALLLLGGAAANTALGLDLGDRLHDLVAGQPAPPPVEARLRDEATAERIVPLFARTPNVDAEKAHGVMGLETSSGLAALWTVPTNHGPVCYFVELVTLSEQAGAPRGDSRCTPRPSATAALVWSRTRRTVDGRELTLIAGYMAENVSSVSLRSPEGATIPVRTAERFFLAELPAPATGYSVIAHGPGGEEIKSSMITDFTAGFQDAVLRKASGPARTVIATKDSRGRPLTLTLRPAEGGEVCATVKGRGGGSISCATPDHLRTSSGISVHPALVETMVFLDGSVGREVATLTLEHEDGTEIDLPIVERFVLYDIPCAHFYEGARPIRLVGRDKSGRVVASEAITQRVFGPRTSIWPPEKFGPC
jgi:hypothetical protein